MDGFSVQQEEKDENQNSEQQESGNENQEQNQGEHYSNEIGDKVIQSGSKNTVDVIPGESLGNFAQRVGKPVTAIRDANWNEISDDGNHIFADNLVVPE
jgi:hypothetical protein